jgi:rhodanese-related sulfurtransferase
MKFAIALISLAIIATSGRASESTAAPVTKTKRVGVEEYDQLRTATNTVLLDVRTAAEFEKGRIPHAINIDFNSPRFAERISALDTNKTYLVNCAVGMRSARACQKMEALGFGKVYDLGPGFDGWKKALKPVEK